MLSNYTIKQMLPRLIVAAVLINISYWVCALAVDASNLLGRSLYELLANLAPMHLDGDAIVALTQVILSAGALVGGGALVTNGVMSLAGTTVAGLFGAISGQLTIGVILLFVSLLLGAFAAVFVGLFILAARQALVIILIVVSPIAFALYILPGTKKLFDKWQKLFTTMLIFFPLFAILYGGAQLAASILISLSAATGGVGDSSFLLKGVFLFMGFCIQFVPLFFTWFLMTKATGFIGEMGSKALQRANSLARDPLRSAAGKQFRSAGATAGHHLGSRFLKRDFSPTTRRGRAMQRLQKAIAGAGLSAAAEKAEFQEAKQSTIEGDHRLSALHERAANAKERTEGVEAKMETARLRTDEGIAARHARNNAKKLHKAQENAVEGARVRSFAGQAADDAAKNSEEDLKAAQGASEIRRLRTTAGAQATQNRKNVEGYVQGTEADVERRRLASPEGQRSYEFQKNAEGRLETQQHTSETARLGTVEGAAVEHAKEDAAGELKVAQNDVKTARLQNSVSQAIEHRAANSADILKAAQNSVETIRLTTPGGQAAFETLKNTEDMLTGQQNDSEAIRLTTTQGQAAFKVREDSTSKLKVAQSQAGTIRLQDAGSRRIEQEAKNAEDWLKAEQSDVETERIRDDVNGGAAAISAAKSAEVTRSSASTALDAEHMKNNNELYVEQAASNEEFAEAKADLEQQTEEYRTEAGLDAERANSGPLSAKSLAAGRIKNASDLKRIDSDATEAARRVGLEEYDKVVTESGAIARMAAGVDPTGARRAQAVAGKRTEARLSEAVGQAKSTMTSTNYAKLLDDGMDSSIDLVDRMAAVGTVAASGDMGAKMRMLEKLEQKMITLAAPIESAVRGANTQAAGESNKDYDKRISSLVDEELVKSNDPEITAVRYMQKQVRADMGEAPFALGDTMRGDYGRGVSRKGLLKSFNERIKSDLTGAALGRLKPEEVGYIVDEISSGRLDGTYAAALQTAIDEANSDSDIRTAIKPKNKEAIARLVASGHLTHGLRST